MERRSANTWLVAALAVAVGFLAALLILRGNDSNNSSATVATTTPTLTTATTQGTVPAPQTTTTATTTGTSTTAAGAAPGNPQPTTTSCINLWNQPNNRGNQTFLVNLFSRQPVREHVAVTADVPPKCQVTVVANNGDAYVFPEAGGTTYPYAQVPAAVPASGLPADQKISNALEQSDGTLKAR